MQRAPSGFGPTSFYLPVRFLHGFYFFYPVLYDALGLRTPTSWGISDETHLAHQPHFVNSDKTTTPTAWRAIDPNWLQLAFACVLHALLFPYSQFIHFLFFIFHLAQDLNLSPATVANYPPPRSGRAVLSTIRVRRSSSPTPAPPASSPTFEPGRTPSYIQVFLPPYAR